MRILFVFLILLNFSCTETVWEKSSGKESLYAAVSGNLLLPPDGVSAKLEGESPRLTWNERDEAFGYRVYRTIGSDDNWIPLHSEPVRETVFDDPEISVLTHSGVWRYAVATVNGAGQEGFLSQAAALTVYAPEFAHSSRIISVSSMTSSESGESEECGGIRICFESVPEAVSYAVLRRESGKGSVVLTEDVLSTAAGGDITDEFIFYDDTTALPGIFYSYRVIPIDTLGRYGKESESVEGFIFPAPVTEGWDISFETACASVFLTPEFRTRTLGLCLRLRDPEDNQLFTVYRDFRYGFPDRIVLEENEIVSFLNGKDSRWLSVSTAAVFSNAEGQSVLSEFSKEQSLLFFSKESASLPVPTSVSVTNGKMSFSGDVKIPLQLKWKKQSDERVRGYRIYRTEKLLFADGIDQSEWGSPIEDINADQFSDWITWNDSSFSRFGAFYYKINPYADENTETQNNRSVGSFVCAAVFPFEEWTLNASYREFTDRIRLRWNRAEGIETYRFSCYPKQAGSYSCTGFEKAGQGDGSGHYYDFLLTTPGESVFSFEPVVIFSDGNREIGSAVGDPSVSAVGAVEVTTRDWVRLIMTAVASSQRKILPGYRDSNKQQVLFDVSFYRRQTPYIWSNNYDLYGFKKSADKYRSIEVTGSLAHIYYEKKNTHLRFSYSVDFSMPMADKIIGDIDQIRKKSAPLIVTGVYPGKLYIWGSNAGAEEKNSETGLLPGVEFADISRYPYLLELEENLGFDFSYPSGTGFYGESTYAAFRDEKNILETVFYSDIGSIHLMDY